MRGVARRRAGSRQVVAHQHVVDRAALDLEQPAQGALDLEAAGGVERTRRRVVPEHPQRELARALAAGLLDRGAQQRAADATAEEALVDGQPLELAHVADGRDVPQLSDLHVARELAVELADEHAGGVERAVTWLDRRVQPGPDAAVQRAQRGLVVRGGGADHVCRIMSQ
nr:hypothetical protein [Solirubrobacter pauli]